MGWWENPPAKKTWSTRNKQKKSSKRANRGLGGGNMCVVAFIIRIYKAYRRF